MEINKIMRLENLYKTIFVQVWLLIISTMIFIGGIVMLNDLHNYKYVITEGYGANSALLTDEQGTLYRRVYIDCKAKLMYSLSWPGLENGEYEVMENKGYEVKSDGIYLDIYERNPENDELIFLKTIHSDTYSEIFYDVDYGDRITIIPRIENIKYKYPAWRIYVPIFLFVLSLSVMISSIYSIIVRVIEKIKNKKEYKVKIDE